ncbi:type II toxin-antitoxin system YafQ family toxin [Bradyrhizobium zhanjiangense]|uniref:Type II toxin-antitoxin system YafQ family toxin n=1 Tax=Bradyrhizobium zhanjiangense TaxID=1325107 RepID=A0A4Q0QB12_9BRAD|nr:type II toxin-antitoxin system YafQ family toxin [Bradyrhizobium zhanjiangense]RXG85874.1 type II toxin-antitoxin system YafQ family toxin [Bradyrhizobium zhanjiangense]RXG86890.1 type II toxin-antitoxin system YafQ family toxin [Bradyrhizobium zhanjiangense]
MKPLRLTTQYKKDLKRIKSRGYRIDKLVAIVNKLRSGTPLLPIDDDHPLKGPWESYRGCHVQGDWCLIYKNEPDELVLVRTGTHSDLFEK